MKIFLLCLFISLLNLQNLPAQSISEKELFLLTYKGSADAFNFKYDDESGTYCYLYRIENQNKEVILSNNSVSEKFDYIIYEDLKFDNKGNYFAFAGNTKSDYGADNNFLIFNGKSVFNSDFIESYSSYINKDDELVFVFKEDSLYRFGYFSIKNGLRKSEPYDLIKAAFKYNPEERIEGDAEINVENFYTDESGERGFIAISNGKAKFIFGQKEIQTDYSDIYETGVAKNKKGELSYIAKKGKRFFEGVGNEFVVSGEKEYNSFELVTMPLVFDNNNEPVYVAGDSLTEDKYEYYLIKGNERQPVYSDASKSLKISGFSYGISNLKLNDEGDPTYFAATEVVIPGAKKSPDENVYDEYYTKSYFVKNNVANELGFNLGKVVYDENGAMMYSGIADLSKKEALLMMNYGQSKIIMNKQMFDDIYEYGFTPSGDVFYIGQNYEDSVSARGSETLLYIKDKLAGKYDFLVFQNVGDSSSILKFNSLGNYAFVANEKLDSVTYSDFVVTNSGRLLFPSGNVTDSKWFAGISNMMYSVNNRLFFIGDMKFEPLTYETTKEVFVDNKSLGKIYSTINNLKYNSFKNEITFIGARENRIYQVTVKF